MQLHKQSTPALLTWEEAYTLIFEKGMINSEIEFGSGRMYQLNVDGQTLTVVHAATGMSAMTVN